MYLCSVKARSWDRMKYLFGNLNIFLELAFKHILFLVYTFNNVEDHRTLVSGYKYIFEITSGVYLMILTVLYTIHVTGK